MPRLREANIANGIIGWAFQSGLINRLVHAHSRLLTILCYHRIQTRSSERFQGFCDNISASPEAFQQQIGYLRAHFSPISAAELGRCIHNPDALPPHPVLVTFDDGYRDNGEIAWPILKTAGVPAIVFLATDHIGSGRPFAWDFAAYCFREAKLNHADVPLLGPTLLDTPPNRLRATAAWIDACKACPAQDRDAAMERLQDALEISVDPEPFRHLYLSWEAVRQLASDGLEFGGHTRTHPILRKIPLADARAEIAGCHQRIYEALGHFPIAFAYPNGSRQDFGREHEDVVRDTGYQLGFSMEPGPMSLAAARRRPMALRRIYIGYDDGMPRFAAKLAGAMRLARAPSLTARNSRLAAIRRAAPEHGY
jgi:peptidoglycan/xylan/chitin deacetylase (PgdA/CDA1 family)